MMRQRMPKKPKCNEEWWAKVYFILERFPSAFPTFVTLIDRDPAKDWAWCSKRGETFTIKVQVPDSVDESLADAWITECFIHEYAHILGWSHLHDKFKWAHWHDETWGVWYSRLYRAWSGDK